MKPRIRRLLDTLKDTDGFVPVAELAEAVGAGVRTVFRDIQELEFLLGEQGIVIEKRRSVGIRLLGDLSVLKPVDTKLKKTARLAGLSIHERQMAILGYLGSISRIVKLAELATLFYVSDSCISGDLKELDQYIENSFPEIILERQKGIGVCMNGPEWSIRMLTLHALKTLIHPQKLIQYILSNAENGQLEQLLTFLGYPHRRLHLNKAISETENALGYRISWQDYGTLFLYLVISQTRMGEINKDKVLDIPAAIPENITRQLWITLLEDGKREISDFELRHLGLLLSALEPGEIRESNRCHPEIDGAVSAFLAALEQERNPLYTFDSRLYYMLRVGLSAYIYKKLLNIPSGSVAVAIQDSDPAAALQLHSLLAPILGAMFGIVCKENELESIDISIRAAEERLGGAKKQLRVLVACFEGIFLAQFIASAIRRHFPELQIVSVLSCNRATDSWIHAHDIDLIITSFPTGTSAAPEFIIQLPFDLAIFRSDLNEMLDRLQLLNRNATGKEELHFLPDTQENYGQNQNDKDIETAMQILSNFMYLEEKTSYSEEQRIRRIAEKTTKDKKRSELLIRDIQHRESLGEVFLEESGIRLYHCRSKALSEARFGIIGTACFILAPERPDEQSIKTLSQISVALLENNDFTSAIIQKDMHSIKRQLFSILAESL